MTRRFLTLTAILFAAQISARADSADLIKSSVLENDAAYLRVGDVGKNLPGEIQSAQTALAATNKIVGTVLDLRFAGGDDLDSALAVEHLLTREKLPLAILVNDETLGAAEKLAEALRDARAGLIFGSSTELKPDLSISVSARAERKFLKNPYAIISTNESDVSPTTNDFLPFVDVDHTTEADLVRAKIKDGDADESFASQQPPAPQKPVIRDPVLARGLDFIRGLMVFRQSKAVKL